MLTINDAAYEADLERFLDIAIPVSFGSEQLSAFGAPPAKKETYKVGEFTGSVAQGGSCNCEIYTFIPHCNGTHTESVGHITEKKINVYDVLKDSLLPASLVTVMPVTAAGCDESYNDSMNPNDLVITKKSFEGMSVGQDIKALLVRTLPNDKEKVTRDYSVSMPPYFTLEAMEYIATSGIRHLLVDMPSVDRLDDGGTLLNHKIFWGVAEGETEAALSPKTITELIYVPDEVKDGIYVLNLQIAPFMADATPSRPVLYEVTKI